MSDEQLASLFGIEAQDLQGWRDRAIPVERTSQVDRMPAFVKLMLRRLRPDRIPAIVRTPAEGLRGGTMLDELRAGHEAELMEYVERLAAYPNS